MTTTQTMTDVDLDLIVPNPWQPRTGIDPEYIHELQESIVAPHGRRAVECYDRWCPHLAGGPSWTGGCLHNEG